MNATVNQIYKKAVVSKLTIFFVNSAKKWSVTLTVNLTSV